jgi:hypothetical protein
MRQNPNEGDPASDRVDKVAADLAGAVGEVLQSNSELQSAFGFSEAGRTAKWMAQYVRGNRKTEDSLSVLA